jgi:hypothetical protein
MADIVVLQTLIDYVEQQDVRTKKLFLKQKKFMEMNPFYPSLGRKTLTNVKDRYGNMLFEIRLNIHRRIICLERNSKIYWLKITTHDEIRRNNIISIDGWSG